jgi:hypothetical protein
MASSKSALNVAIPHRRGGAVETKAIRISPTYLDAIRNAHRIRLSDGIRGNATKGGEGVLGPFGREVDVKTRFGQTKAEG